MSRINRRRFIQKGTAALALATVPFESTRSEELLETATRSNAGDTRTLAFAAVEAAKGAGATYADVSFRSTKREIWHWWAGTSYPVPRGVFALSAGVRALHNGCWGFAGIDGIATVDDMVRLGQDAVAQAKNSPVAGKYRSVELAFVPVVSDGTWSTPVTIDPFIVSNDEKIDFICAITDYLGRERVQVDFAGAGLYLIKDEHTFASTEGSYIAQNLYTTSCDLYVTVEKHFLNESRASRKANFITASGAGWEYVLNAPFQDKASQFVEDTARSRYGKPINVGRYDIVFDAYSMASILDATIGPATELDRAFGYKANEEGTSFLSEPLEMLGAYRVGSPLINISANRSMKDGAATVGWDDEGVEPRDTALVTQGILTDFQTTRESASWMAPYYNNSGKTVRSGGCAGREKASIPTSSCAPNLVLSPGKDNATFQDLIAGTKRGYAVIGSQASADTQALNGSGRFGIVYEIRNGKLGDVVQGSTFLFRAPELWRNIVGIGGNNTAESFGLSRGGYWSEMYHTVSAVPAKVTGIAMVDTMRKA